MASTKKCAKKQKCEQGGKEFEPSHQKSNTLFEKDFFDSDASVSEMFEESMASTQEECTEPLFLDENDFTAVNQDFISFDEETNSPRKRGKSKTSTPVKRCRHLEDYQGHHEKRTVHHVPLFDAASSKKDDNVKEYSLDSPSEIEALESFHPTTPDSNEEEIRDMGGLLNTYKHVQAIQSCQLKGNDFQAIETSENIQDVIGFQDAFDIDDDLFTEEDNKDVQEFMYQGSQLRYEESMLLIMAFCVRHKLSGAASSDLINLISLHCPENANVVKNFRQFKNFFRSLDSPMIKHYYCPATSCQVYYGDSEPQEGARCSICKQLICKDSFFIELPVEDQLRSLLSNPEFQEKLQYRFKRKKSNQSAIEDIYDGELYKQLSAEGGFLSSPYNMSLVGNTDGVAVVKSSGASVWPVYLVINELSPKERFSRKNRIFAGLWFGKGKPHFPTFMRPFVLSINKLHFGGIQMKVPNKDSVTFRVMVLDMSLDAPARCLWTCTKQFNGYFGCGKCKEPGEQLDLGPGKGNSRRQCHIYPYNTKKATTTGHAPCRTHEEMKQQAMKALANLELGMSKPSVEGVLGLAWGFGLPKYDIIKGTSVDYMHCVCEGVVEQHLEKWFGTGDSNLYPCFIGSMVNTIDQDMQSIKPIAEITRKPRKITDRKDWKASEKKSFLLYFSIPCLIGRLPEVYLEHYMLLVGAIYRLLKDSISTMDLETASLYLKLYCAQVPGLYGERFQTFNCHQLLHLGEDVRSLGPLWTSSCFPFEDYNGDLKELFHGTLNISGQIINSVSVLQRMPEIAEKTTISPCVRSAYDELMGKTYQSQNCRTEKIDEKSYVIGGMKKRTIQELDQDQELYNALKARGHPIGDVFWEFKRCCANNVVFHSASYLKVTVRNNYTALTDNSEYVSVTKFIKVTDRCTEARCAVEKKCLCRLRPYYYAIVRRLRSVPIKSAIIQDQPVIDHIFKVQESNAKFAIPIDVLKKKVLRMDVASGSYISLMPNLYEKD